MIRCVINVDDGGDGGFHDDNDEYDYSMIIVMIGVRRITFDDDGVREEEGGSYC
jgi:hypothetical protein